MKIFRQKEGAPFLDQKLLTEPLYNPDDTFIRENEKTGVLEVVHIMTGDVVGYFRSEAKYEVIPVKVNRLKTEDGACIFMQEGVDPGDAVYTGKKIPFNPIIADLICSRVSSGVSLKKVCEMEGMPSYGLVCKWRRKNEAFDKALLQAFEDYADYVADKVVEIADTCSANKDAVAKASLQVDTLKYKAQVHKPRIYSPRMKVSGDEAAPLKLVIETGIRRPGDPGFHVDETKKLRDVSEDDSSS